jgi:hypothetical protein
MFSTSRHEDPLNHSAQRLGLYIADAEAAKAISRHPSTSSVKSDTVASLKNSFLLVLKDGLGQGTVMKATLTVKQNATPVYRLASPVPYTSLRIVEQELDRLLNLGVFKPVRHVDWVAPVMVAKKPDGSPWLCVDYSTGISILCPLSLPLMGVMYSHKLTSPVHICRWNLTSRRGCATSTQTGVFINTSVCHLA